ncbi:hypothetical protein PP304_gp045 [Gordonia phage Phendrix]|uniref:Uncharacterized protein n=2 Tax=Godonkavirus TaxID=2733178 RepID=A0A4D6E2D2_9CAUD|nr:hypothetical protein HOV33_gp045 [Gordonia phage GodonK]YP_010649089.1 hypothetical protein PP304_gp045 [Gordonia phage Phendrix]QBZ72664.1 hypothetical protein SEA_GODONK_45 [Gordonia phage GodonK]QDK02593.1 hypothetical protein SEA_PHENDRIX_45 [Gordonia phage Phendrix]
MIETQYPSMTLYIRRQLFNFFLHGDGSDDDVRQASKRTDDWFDLESRYRVDDMLAAAGITRDELTVRWWLSCPLGARHHGFEDDLYWKLAYRFKKDG